jgi:hypothetical protein
MGDAPAFHRMTVHLTGDYTHRVIPTLSRDPS